MPIFEIDERVLRPVEQHNFEAEKELQTLIEENLGPVFNCRFVASEFSTGAQHAGRIDTLALSEDDNPVIIEYKKTESSQLVNQSLFYLHWLSDHRGDFEIAVQQALGADTAVDWADVRVLCIAPDYKKYDIHAVQVMGANIELWRYRLFKNQTIYLEEVLQRSFAGASIGPSRDEKDPLLTATGKKATPTRAIATYTFEEHLKGKPENVRRLARLAQDFIMDLDSAMEEVPRKNIVAYKISQNIVCVHVQHRRLLLFLKLNPTQLNPFPENARDVSAIGHYGTGDLELSIRSEEELERAKPLIERSYQKIGG